MSRSYLIRSALTVVCLVGLGAVLALPGSRADDIDTARKAEAERMKVIESVRPAVVALFAPGGGNGGSGVLIDAEGYLLTNFHVVAATGMVMKCGLPDGVLYDGVVVGIDKVGDVSLVKLIPKKEGAPFPFVKLGNSDTVKAGEWSIAMGNPFLLATDFSPTVTYGLVSGTNRYQYPDSKDGTLEYTDCIQIDTSINPGNSGGPLFNMKGELIGINGRGSFDKRSRINSGVGYAISINQIKNFLGHLHAGLEVDHATLGAAVKTDVDDQDIARITVREVLDDSDAARRGLLAEDELVSFAGRPITSTNQYKNILGIYPKDWRMPLVYRRNGEKKETLIRLQGLSKAEKEEAPKKDQPAPKPQPVAPPKPSPASKFYKAREGYANAYFNEQAVTRILGNLKKSGDFAEKLGTWTITGTSNLDGRASELKITLSEKKGADADVPEPVAQMTLNGAPYLVEPRKRDVAELDLMEPPNSGGLLVAMYQFKRFLTMGPKGFEGNNFTHGGVEPFYPMPLDDAKKTLKEIRVMAEVLRTSHVAVPAKWYFFRKDLNPEQPDKYPDGALIGFEIFLSNSIDPCEVYFHDIKSVGGRTLPGKMEVRHAEKRYGVFTLTGWDFK